MYGMLGNERIEGFKRVFTVKARDSINKNCRRGFLYLLWKNSSAKKGGEFCYIINRLCRWYEKGVF